MFHVKHFCVPFAGQGFTLAHRAPDVRFSVRGSHEVLHNYDGGHAADARTLGGLTDGGMRRSALGGLNPAGISRARLFSFPLRLLDAIPQHR
jgi:hypothetical protein